MKPLVATTVAVLLIVCILAVGWWGWLWPKAPATLSITENGNIYEAYGANTSDYTMVLTFQSEEEAFYVGEEITVGGTFTVNSTGEYRGVLKGRAISLGIAGVLFEDGKERMQIPTTGYVGTTTIRPVLITFRYPSVVGSTEHTLYLSGGSLAGEVPMSKEWSRRDIDALYVESMQAYSQERTNRLLTIAGVVGVIVSVVGITLALPTQASRRRRT